MLADELPGIGAHVYPHCFLRAGPAALVACIYRGMHPPGAPPGGSPGATSVVTVVWWLSSGSADLPFPAAIPSTCSPTVTGGPMTRWPEPNWRGGLAACRADRRDHADPRADLSQLDIPRAVILRGRLIHRR